jgi:hypothetical protein
MARAEVTTSITEPAAPAPAPTVLTYGRLPFNIDLFGNSPTVFAQAAALIRFGYVFTPSAPPMIYPNGNASVFLVLGSPDRAAFNDAKEAAETARAAEEADFEARVQSAAKQIVDTAAKAARQAELDAQIAEQKRALAALEAAAAAA